MRGPKEQGSAKLLGTARSLGRKAFRSRQTARSTKCSSDRLTITNYITLIQPELLYPSHIKTNSKICITTRYSYTYRIPIITRPMTQRERAVVTDILGHSGTFGGAPSCERLRRWPTSPSQPHNLTTPPPRQGGEPVWV